MEYFQQMTDYSWGEHTLCIRPHPMMWDNFLKEGRLTEERIQELFMLWDQRHINVDKNTNIETTFEQTDILVSDPSSVILMFFLTGKPIILCPFIPEGYSYSPLIKSIFPGLYIANNWQELQDHIEMLLMKKDPLLTVREEIIKTKFLRHKNATENIVQYILKDFQKNRGM